MFDGQALTSDLAAIGDDLERAKEAGRLLEDLAATIDDVGQVRRAALEELLRSGYTKAQIARELGVAPSRVSQLLSSGEFGAPARKFLDGGPMTVVLGGKTAADKPEAVASADALSAWDTLRDLASRYKRDATCEIAGPPGNVRLNRPGLVVVGSPRLLPAVGRIVDANSPYRFQRDNGGIYLVDTNTSTDLHSPMDIGEHEDFAFLGRLPRPDNRGHFLYLAGIHGPGTRGAAQWLAGNAPELWRAAKHGPFSVLLKIAFDGDTRDALHVEKVTDIHVPAA